MRITVSYTGPNRTLLYYGVIQHHLEKLVRKFLDVYK
jgi:hypothetical protein